MQLNILLTAIAASSVIFLFFYTWNQAREIDRIFKVQHLTLDAIKEINRALELMYKKLNELEESQIRGAEDNGGRDTIPFKAGGFSIQENYREN